MKQLGKILALLCVLGLALGQARADSNQWPWTDAVPPAGAKIGYVQTRCRPCSAVKPVQGKTYEDLVPDTTDIAEMSKLAINVLTCGTNRRQDYEQYFSVYMGNPLRMAHNFSDWCTPKYMEALALLRVVTGSTSMAQVDQTWQDVILKSIGPDGLYYFPLRANPGTARSCGGPTPSPAPTAACSPSRNRTPTGSRIWTPTPPRAPIRWLRNRASGSSPIPSPTAAS